MSWFEKIFSEAAWGKNPSIDQKWIKWRHRNLSDNHCPECLILDECWFLKSKTPKHPHHNFCHCVLDKISYHDVWSSSSAICPYEKFNPYLFDPENFYKHGKNEMLESWGYTIEDAKYLQEQIQSQGLEKYINGDYKLGILNEYGQRISITVELPRKNHSGMISFTTGWMVKPNGQIQLNTPYGGK